MTRVGLLRTLRIYVNNFTGKFSTLEICSFILAKVLILELLICLYWMLLPIKAGPQPCPFPYYLQKSWFDDEHIVKYTLKVWLDHRLWSNGRIFISALSCSHRHWVMDVPLFACALMAPRARNSCTKVSEVFLLKGLSHRVISGPSLLI